MYREKRSAKILYLGCVTHHSTTLRPEPRNLGKVFYPISVLYPLTCLNLELLLLLLQQIDELGNDVLHLVLRLDGQRVVLRQSGRVEPGRVQRQLRLQREVRVAL